MLEDPKTGGIGSVLNMQLVKVLEGANNGDGGSLLNLQLVFFLECFLLLDKVGGQRGTCYTALELPSGPGEGLEDAGGELEGHFRARGCRAPSERELRRPSSWSWHLLVAGQGGRVSLLAFAGCK